jgi:hypothetical protein
MIKKIHLWIGILGIVLFLLSGQYFKLALDALQGMEDAPRLLLRTSHIYLFLASIINFIFGLYYIQPQKVKWYTLYNQLFIMLSPILIAYGFVFETLNNEGINRTVGSLGIFLIFAWFGNIIIGKVYQVVKFNKTSNPAP